MPITKPIILGTLQGPSFAWSELRGFHDRVNAAESSNEAQAAITCQISGDTLTATITRPLTPAEELQQVAAEREAERALLREILTGQFGRGLAPDRADQLRRWAGLAPGHEQGTQAAPAGGLGDGYLHKPGEYHVPTDEERAVMWFAHWRPMGFKFPEVQADAVALRTEIANVARPEGILPGLDEATVERWNGWAPGAIDAAVKAARGG